jgi:hypothetical protein
MKTRTYTGELDYTQDKEYILTSPGGVVNISKLLEKVYYHSTNNHIQIKIMNKTKTLFNEDGILFYDKVAPKKYKLSVSSEILEDVLQDSVGLDLEIVVNAEALDELREEVNDYGSDNTTKK